ncbi:MAG TPA: universal stress protein UspA [Roseiflexaceae bacterium]|nr:universal stress protein UspA [Roseiflexaceae bacterium]
MCIRPDDAAERVIHAGARAALELTAELYAIHIESPGAHTRRDPDETRQLEALLRLAADLGAQIEVIADHRVVEAIAAYASDHQITRIIIGRSHAGRIGRFLHIDLATRLQASLDGVHIEQI